MPVIIALILTTIVSIRDIDGRLLSPFQPDSAANVVFFITSDCPISNFYAQEIQRVCSEYGPKGAKCSLIYEDVEVKPDDVRKHLTDYGYRGIPAAIDGERRISNAANATVTPQAVVIDRKGEIRYRGRIDDFYADLGRPRRQATVHDLRNALDAVLAGKPVLNAETQAVGCYIEPADTLRKGK